MEGPKRPSFPAGLLTRGLCLRLSVLRLRPEGVPWLSVAGCLEGQCEPCPAKRPGRSLRKHLQENVKQLMP